jgi:tetratricopeptide (TPR) repeat protein
VEGTLTVEREFRDTLETALDTHHPGWDVRRRAAWSERHAEEWEKNRQFDVWVDTLKRWVRGDNFPRPSKFADFLDATEFPAELQKQLHDLYHMARQIRRGKAPQMATAIPDTTQIVGTPPHTTPHFMGRQDDILILKDLILSGDHPVISIVGRPGIGKKALALRVLQELADEEAVDVIAFADYEPESGETVIRYTESPDDIRPDGQYLSTVPLPAAYHYPLYDGLAEADGVRLLQALGVGDLSIVDLRKVVHRLQGIPRFIELFAVQYDSHPLTSLDDLLNAFVEEPAVASLMEATLNTLSEREREVVTTLALLGRGSTLEELEGVIGHSVNHLPAIVSVHSGYLSLEPLDSSFIRRTISKDERSEREHRMADYYSSFIVPLDEWATIDDINGSIRTFAHFLKAGDRNAARHVMTDAHFERLLDIAPLKVLAMRQQLLAHDDSPQNRMGIALAHERNGDFQQVIETLQGLEAYPPAATLLGDVYHLLQQRDEALQAYQQVADHPLARLGMSMIKRDEALMQTVLAAARRRYEPDIILQALFALAGYYRDQARHDEALQFNQEAFEFVNSRYMEGRLLCQRALLLADVGQFQMALQLHEGALEAMTYLRGEYWGRLFMAYRNAVLKAMGEPVKVDYPRPYPLDVQLKETRDDAGRLHKLLDMSIPRLEHRVLVYQGMLQLRRGQARAAMLRFEQALVAADHVLNQTPGYFRARYTRGLALAGMALRAMENDRMTAIVHAQDAYQDAVQSCAAEGIIEEEAELLSTLAPLDETELLEPLLRIIA